MTISRTMRSLSEPKGRNRVPVGEISYVQTRTKMKAFNMIHKEFQNSGLTKAELACRLGKGADRVNKIMAAPGNWTLDTISELLYAINGGIIEFDISQPLREPKRNDTAPHWLGDDKATPLPGLVRAGSGGTNNFSLMDVRHSRS